MTRRLRSGWRTGEEPERGHALCSDEQKRLPVFWGQESERPE